MTTLMKSDNYLRYGQIIRIHGNESKDDRKGLVVVKGFTNLDARYMTYRKFSEIKNYREGLFQILPKGIFEMHEELSKHLKEEGAGSLDESQLSSLQARARTELEQYHLLIDSKNGEFIYFGDDIILYHVDSGAYLSGSVQCSDGGLGSFKVELSDMLSSMLVFKLLPFRSYQKESDRITLECPLRIKNMKNRCYLSKEMDEKVGKSRQAKRRSEGDDRFRDFARRLPDDCVQYNVVTTYSQVQTWMIYLHETHPSAPKKSAINTHDLIYLIHTHNRGFLTSQENQLILKEPLTEDPRLFSALWEIQFLPPKGEGAVEERVYPHTPESQFCLRELLSGKTLGVYSLNGVMVPQLFDETQPIIIKSVKGGDLQQIKDGSLVKISLVLQDQIVDLDAKEYLPEPKPVGRYFFSKDLQYKKRMIVVGDHEGEIDHGYRMIKIGKETQRDVLFALSAHQILYQFTEMVGDRKAMSASALKEQDLRKIDKTIRQLIAFIQNSPVEEFKDEKYKPIKERQIIFKDLLILDIFFKILELMGFRIREEIYKQSKNEHEMFKEIFRNGYVLVYKIIKNNLTTKLYVSEWIEVIIAQAIEIDENMIHITLNEILSSNEVVVSKYLSKSIIQKLLDIFINQPPHEKYLRIMRSSCICDSLPILNNQNNILEEYFLKIEKIPEIMFRFKEEGSTIKIFSSISKKSAKLRTLSEFHKQSNINDVKQTWQYLMSCLNLMADICYGRNQKAKSFVEGFVRLNHLCLILENEDIKEIGKDSKDLLRAILRIINYAFVDTVGQDSITRTSRIRHYDSIEERKDISRISISNPDLERVLAFLKKELSNFESFESTDKKELEFFLTILELLRSTLISGYWENLAALSAMVPCLLKIMMNEKAKILNSYREKEGGEKISKAEQEQRAFQKYKENVLKPIPENELIIKCKLLATELLEIIFDFQIDVRVSQITMLFKQINQAPEQFENFIEHEEKVALFNVSVWRAKLTQLFSKDSVLSKVDLNYVNYNLVFMELSQHQNPELLAKSLKILKRIIEKRSQTINNFMNISLYSAGPAQKKASHALSKRKKFGILNDENMLTATFGNQHGFHYNVWYEREEVIKDLQRQYGVAYDKKDGAIKYGQKKEGDLQRKDEAIHDLQKKVGVIQDLYFFCENLKEKPSGARLRLESLFPKDELYCFFNERECVNHLSQNIIKCTEIHRELLSYITLCKKERIPSMGELALKLLHAVYMFLSLLVKNNLEAKKEIMHYRHLFLEHTEFNCGAIELLREIYFNNKELLYAQPEIEQATFSIMRLVKSQPEVTYYKSKQLDFFRCFVLYNEKCIHYNATLIMSKMQDPDPRIIVYNFEAAEVRTEVDRYEASYAEAAAGHSRVVHLSELLVYYSTIFSLFSNLIEDLNLVNIGKCKQVHDYLRLIEIMRVSKNCWPLKRSLRAYINRLYYLTDNYENLLDIILKQEVPTFIEDLDKIIEIKLLYDAHFREIEIANPVRYKFLETYLYLYFEEVLISINETFNNSFFIRKLEQHLNSNYSRGRYYLHYFIFRIFERLACLKHVYKANRFARSFISSLLNNLKDTFLNRFAKVYPRIFDKNEEGINHEDPATLGSTVTVKDRAAEAFEDIEKKKKNTAKLELRSEMLIKRLQMGQIKTYYIDKVRYSDATKKNYPLTFLLPEQESDAQPEVEVQVHTSKPKIKESSALVERIKNLFSKDADEGVDQSEKLNESLKRVETVMMTEEFRWLLDQQFHQRSEELFLNDPVSRKFYDFETPYITLQEWIKTIVKTNSQYPEALGTDLKIFFFKLMRRFVESKNETGGRLPPIDLWEESDWAASEEAVVQSQNYLNECGVAEYLCECLKENLEEKIELANEILLFGIAFLLGGNKDCQSSILGRLRQDKKNDVCVKLSTLIEHIGRINYKHFKSIKQKKADEHKFSVTLLDNFDYYDLEKGCALRHNHKHEEGLHEARYKELCVEVFRRVFRFIQLLCENNNIESKHFILCQTDAEGNRMASSINFIEVTTLEVRKHFKIMNKAIVRLPLFLLDFINEVCQIPCELNQINLCSTTFFEDVCYMASFLSNEENLHERSFKVLGRLEVGELYRIYLKVIEIILSVFEGNIESIDLQLAAKVEFKFLLDVVQNRLGSMNIRTEEDIKLYFQQVRSEKFLHPSIADVIRVLIILTRLEDKQPCSRLILSYRQYMELHPDEGNILKIIRMHICGIEIIIDSKKQQVYFPLHPVFEYLSGSTRDKIMAEVKRETQREKLVGILSRKNEIFLEIEHNHFLSQNTFCHLPLSSKNVETLYSLSTFLSILINVLFLLQHEVDIRYFRVEYIPENGLVEVAIVLISYVQLCVTLLYFIGWWRMREKMTRFLEDNNNRQREKARKENKSGEEQSSGVGWLLGLLLSPLLRVLSPLRSLAAKVYVLDVAGDQINRVLNSVYMMLMWEEGFASALIFVMVSFAGTFYQKYFFMIHQFSIFARINVLQNVFQAIAYNAKQLIIVSSLGIVFVFVFSLIGFETYVDTVYQEHSNYCQSVIECILSLYLSGAIGGGMKDFKIVRFTYDLIYFIFFGLLFGNIVSGIMIDTFAELRDRRNEVERDKKNYCFICGIDKATLEKQNNNFTNHTRKEHFLWNYIFFLYELQKKNKMNYTGIEYKISMLKPEVVNWIPSYNEEGQSHFEIITELGGKLRQISDDTRNKLKKVELDVEQFKGKLTDK